MRRTAITTFLACLALAAGLAGIGVLTPAEAITHQGIVVTKEAPVSKKFPGIQRNAPRTAVSAPDPPSCAGPASGAATSYCDWIPLEIPLPTGLAKGDDYALELTLNWPKSDTAALDIWLWDDKQIKAAPGGRKQAGEDGYTPGDTTSDYTQIANATGAARPKRITVDQPDMVKYNLTVLNYNGANPSGYTIEARIVVDEYTPPVESVEPEPEATPSGEDDFEDDFDSSESEDFAATGEGGSATNPFGAALDGVALGCDPILCGISGSDIEEELATPFSGSTPQAQQPAVARPPGAGVLVLWLVVLPVALAAGGAALLRRRRLSAFTPA